jgi:two-component system LytT family response regulator
MKVSTLIADDEPIALAGLRDMLAGIEWVQVVCEATNGPATIEAVERLKPELLILDIQMPGMLGTEVLRSLTHQPFVLFTTAHAQYAATAFELGALDYLLKPFGTERLGAAMQRVRSAIGEPSATSTLDRFREAMSTGPMSRLFVRSGRAIIPVPVTSIHWIEAQGDYITAHVGTAQYLLHLSLGRLEARLDPGKFVRIHRTCIVNLDHVQTFRQTGKGQLVAELTSGIRLPVSRARAQDIRRMGA